MSKAKMKAKKKFIPKKLRKHRQWVAWDYKLDKDGKIKKVPINPKTGLYASVNDPQTWGTFKQAYQRYKDYNLAGIGFVLTKGDPFVAIDLDNCRNPKTGKLSKFAKLIIKLIKSYAEVSPSGRGIRMIAIGELPGPGRKNEHIEMYDCGRYVTITGQCLEGFPKEIRERPKTIKKVYLEYFKTETTHDTLSDYVSPCLLTDKEILSKAMNAVNGEKFKRLWKGDYSGYQTHSEADLAFCSMLAFWTGKDRTKIDSLFRQSGLMRKKWENRPDYRRMTIDKAIASCQGICDTGPTQDIERKIEGLLESSRDNTKDAVKDILKNKDALKSLALLYKRELSEFEAFLQDLKGIDVPVRDVESLRKVVKAGVKKGKATAGPASIEKVDPVTVRSILSEAPISDTLAVPRGWRVSVKGVFREKFASRNNNSDHIPLEEIAPFPVLMQGHLKNITDGTEDIRLAWFDGKKWISYTANRLDIADAKLKSFLITDVL